MEIMAIQALSPLILIAIGIVLLAIEAMFTSLYILWFGFGFMLTAIIESLYPFDSFVAQFGVSSLIAVVLFIILKKPLQAWLNKAKKIDDDFITADGEIAKIKNGMLHHQGTYFKIKNKDIQLHENQNVKIIKIEKNSAWIEEIK